MTILPLVRAQMTAQKITQVELAARTGIRQGQLSLILAGKVDPRLSSVEKILTAVGLPPHAKEMLKAGMSLGLDPSAVNQIAQT